MMEGIGVVPAIAVKAIRDHRSAKQELDLAARHPDLHAIDVRILQQVPLLNVHPVDARAEEENADPQCREQAQRRRERFAIRQSGAHVRFGP